MMSRLEATIITFLLDGNCAVSVSSEPRTDVPDEMDTSPEMPRAWRVEYTHKKTGAALVFYVFSREIILLSNEQLVRLLAIILLDATAAAPEGLTERRRKIYHNALRVNQEFRAIFENWYADQLVLGALEAGY